MTISTPEPSVQAVLATIGQMTTSQIYDILVAVNTLYAKRRAAERKKAWAKQGPAKLEIDSSRERS